MTNHNHIDEHRDDTASKMGMWLFIFTEILLFGGLFIVYAVYRNMYFEDFRVFGENLNVTLGTLNTVILLVSSMTIAMSISAVQKGDKKLAMALIGFTILVGAIFLVNKYFEWGGKISHGLYPGSDFFEEHNVAKGQVLFIGLYYLMTGLHAFHIIVGMIVLTVLFIYVKKEKINSENFVLLENGGLYWHLVDVIWIFLFPLLYLIT